MFEKFPEAVMKHITISCLEKTLVAPPSLDY